jgi:cell cycle checkpoint control protein RAD9A
LSVGVTKTYRLSYEAVEVAHALFDKENAPLGWKISSRVLREYIEYFGARTEQLDLLVKDGKAVFTSFTEKIMDGKGTRNSDVHAVCILINSFAEILKQPVETAVALHIQDFDDFHAEEDVHIVINVKDFRAIVTHAETLKGALSAQFSRPGRPLLFRSTEHGITCEFILMTSGEYRAAPLTAEPKIVSTRPGRQSSRQASAAPLRPSRQSTMDPDPSTRQPSVASGLPSRQSSHVPIPTVEGEMAPPPRPVPVNGQPSMLIGRRISQATTRSNADSESLFMPLADQDESRWESLDLDEEQGEMLTWDTNADLVSIQPRHPSAFTNISQTAGIHRTFRDAYTHEPPPLSQSLNRDTQGLPPTQRLSQVRIN